MTAVVEITPRLREKSVPQLQSRLSHLADEIEDALLKKGCASESRIYHPDYALRRVAFRPLLVLRTFHQLYKGCKRFQTTIQDWAINLKARDVDKSETLAENLMPREVPLRPAASISVLLTPDTEDRYCRLAFLPKRRLRRVALTVSAHSAKGEFYGVFHNALTTLSTQRLNVFGARNIIITKTDKARGRRPKAGGAPLMASEEARFSFIVDVGTANLDEAKLKVRVCDAMRKSIAESGRASARVESDDIRWYPFVGVDVPVFLATNAKPQMRRRHHWMIDSTIIVMDRLRTLGLMPVNVEVLKEGGDVNQELLELLEACPMLVSLYWPEPKLSLRARTGPAYAASSWTVFEEAYALHRQKKFVFRLRHHAVHCPPFYHRNRELEFCEENFEEKVKELTRRISTVMDDATWWALVDTCSARVTDVKPTLLERDLEGWLRDER